MKHHFLLGSLLACLSLCTSAQTGLREIDSHGMPIRVLYPTAQSLLVPVGAIFTPESLARIRIPVGLTVAEADGVLVPSLHSQYVLRHCSNCRLLSSHAGSGHFDWLAPWPAALARSIAATQMRGGLPNPAFSDAQRQAGFDRIASFFVQHLNTP